MLIAIGAAVTFLYLALSWIVETTSAVFWSLLSLANISALCFGLQVCICCSPRSVESKEPVPNPALHRIAAQRRQLIIPTLPVGRHR